MRSWGINTRSLCSKEHQLAAKLAATYSHEPSIKFKSKMRFELACILLLAVVAAVHAQADVAPKEQGDARFWFTTFTLFISTTTSTTTVTSVTTCTTTTAALTTCSAGRRRRGLFYDEAENQGRARRGLFYNEEDAIALPVKR